MRVADICTRNVVHCSARASVLEVAQLMRNSHVGDVVVVEQSNGERVPIGILTDRDLVIEVMDRNDVNAIFAARGTTVAARDPRDLDGNRLITVNDARGRALRCSKPSCAP
jgi:CBS domain-containing protein